MEFYLPLFDMFCRPGYIVYSVFSSTKIVCAGLVCHDSLSVDSILVQSYLHVLFSNLIHLGLS